MAVLVEGTLSTGLGFRLHEQAFQKAKCLQYFSFFTTIKVGYHGNLNLGFSLGDGLELWHSQNDGHLCIVGL
jgi:hypothetical protein